MKILLVNKFWYIRGGAERVVFATKKVLEEAGHEVAIFGMKHPKNDIENDYFIDYIDYEKANFFQKIRYGFKSVYNRDAKKKFEKLVKDFQPDVVHFHNVCHYLSFSLFDIIKKYQLHAVMTLHDYQMMSPDFMLFHHGKIDASTVGGHYYRCAITNCMESRTKSIASTIEAYVRKWKQWYEVIDVYITPSNFVKNMAVRSGINEQKITVIRNPFDISISPISRHKNDKTVLYMGRLSIEKGVDTLLSASSYIPDIPIVIAGDGPLRTSLEQRVREKNVSNVSFVGHVEGKNLSNIIDDARIIVVPSVWYENAPMSIVEAKVAQKIVIASDIGGIPEMLPHELLVKPHNAEHLAKAIETWYSCSSSQRVAMQKKLHDTIDTHKPETYYRNIMNVYTTQS